MSLFKSKVFGAVAVVGLVGISIFSQSGKDQSEQGGEQQATHSPVIPKAQTIDRVVSEDSHSKFSAAAISALSASPAYNDERAKKVAPKAPEDDLSALIGNAISELGSLAEEENNYISALTGSSNIRGGDADHLNKIDFGSLSIQKQRPIQSFESQMDSLVSDLLATGSKAKTPEKSVAAKVSLKVSENPVEDNGSVAAYIASLAEESETRRNEVRMITVSNGETLWEIAARAYGDGNLYKKIYEANPHIKNPNMIEIGDVLRVPI